jgi:hypothetical protein
VTAAAPVLAPGVRVRPWRHFLAELDLPRRLSLHEGARRVGDGVEPRRPDRPLAPAEVELLDGTRAAEEPGLLLFTTPLLLRERFAALDPDEIPQAGDAAPSPAWEGFSREASLVLERLKLPLRRPWSLLLDVRDPAAPPPLLAGGAALRALRPVPGVAEPWAAHVNLSDVPVAWVWWNLPLPAMARLLAERGEGPPPDLPGLVRLFVERYPSFPLVRLVLAPGEGLLVPVPVVAHDVDANGATDLVVTLSALPA